ncbi:hypothetical protein DV735_g678, partial [Chaetothyriales sp. CBS 134920]
MEAARAAINRLTSGGGQKTTVNGVVGPAVTQEQVQPQRHEEFTQAVNRQVHQDHYNTTVQPISHQETLPEKHTHNLLPTEHKQIQHEGNDTAKAKADAELAQFKDSDNSPSEEHEVETTNSARVMDDAKSSSTVHETKYTQGVAPTVVGEHVHHHVHETAVPVIEKETIQPEVVHTTIPVHETHQAAAQHHGTSALPTKTLDEFNRAGGSLTGAKQHAHEEDSAFETIVCPPRQYNERLHTTAEDLGFAGIPARS